MGEEEGWWREGDALEEDGCEENSTDRACSRGKGRQALLSLERAWFGRGGQGQLNRRGTAV
jgi:hypothetical protein